MKYQILQDESELQSFIDIVLPNMDSPESQQFYVSLLGRNKWNPIEGWKGDQAQLKRFTSSKDRLIGKVKQLECEQGSYTNGDIQISEKNLGLYIMPNPRSMRKAQLNLLKEIANNAANDTFNSNPQAMALTEIQKSPYKKIYFDIDIDIDRKILTIPLREEMHNQIVEVVGIDCYSIFTNGGLHTLVEVDKLSESIKKTWYRKIQSLSTDSIKMEMNGDNLVPLPGTIQGGWVPFLFKK